MNTETLSLNGLREFIRDVPDFPQPGITFKDITPLLRDPKAFRYTIEQMAKLVDGQGINRVVAIESRGFVFGAALAFEIGAGLVIARKPRKLPYKTTKIEYALEYGNDSLEMHVDSLDPKDRVLIVDDVLATGGTARATAQLVELMGAKVQALLFLSELGFLKGRAKLEGYPVLSLMSL
jgi:adenine phosphoribosyltransferase